MSIRYNYSDIDTICSTMLNMGTNDNNTVSSLKQKINTTVNETEGYQSQTFEKAKSYANRAVLPILDAFDEASSRVGTISNSIRQDYQDLCNNENLDLEELEKERSNNIFMLKEQIKDIEKLSIKYPELKEEHLASICDVEEKMFDLDSYYDQKIENLQLFDAKCGLYQQEVTTLYDEVEEKISQSNSYTSTVNFCDTVQDIQGGIKGLEGFLGKADDRLGDITDIINFLSEWKYTKQLFDGIDSIVDNWNKMCDWFSDAVHNVSKWLDGPAKTLGNILGALDIISNFANVNSWDDLKEAFLATAYDIGVDYLLGLITGSAIAGFAYAFFQVTLPFWGTALIAGFCFGALAYFFNVKEIDGKTIKQHFVDGTSDLIDWMIDTTATGLTIWRYSIEYLLGG